MIKRLIPLCLAMTAPMLCPAQKTVKVDIQTSQARLLDVNPNTYVKPLIAELTVASDNGRIRDSWLLSPADLSSRIIPSDDNATLQNLRSYAVFKSSEKHNCDVIVAATFDIHITESGAEIVIVGYPANFTNWKTGTAADYDWIMLVRGETNDNSAPLGNNEKKKSPTK